jgi:hypothetical protein
MNQLIVYVLCESGNYRFSVSPTDGKEQVLIVGSNEAATMAREHYEIAHGICEYPGMDIDSVD